MNWRLRHIATIRLMRVQYSAICTCDAILPNQWLLNDQLLAVATHAAQPCDLWADERSRTGTKASRLVRFETFRTAHAHISQLVASLMRWQLRSNTAAHAWSIERVRATWDALAAERERGLSHFLDVQQSILTKIGQRPER